MDKMKEFEEANKKAKEIKYIDKLELGEGETYIGNLSDADKFQVLSRHIAIIEGYLSQLAVLNAQTVLCLKELAKKQNIDIDKIIDNKE